MQVGVNNSLCESNTRKRVIELRSVDLFMTMSEIAQKVGISRQRVYQILQKEGLPTKHKTNGHDSYS